MDTQGRGGCRIVDLRLVLLASYNATLSSLATIRLFGICTTELGLLLELQLLLLLLMGSLYLVLLQVVGLGLRKGKGSDCLRV